MATRTILVVDDEPGIVAIARDYLDRAGFRVITAGDGTAAVRLARSERPSLLVLDLMLPGMDGLDVARALREDPATHMLPIIMLTARVEEADRLIGLELGADDYITKPFSPREVVTRVRVVLRRVGAEREQEPASIHFRHLAVDFVGHAARLRGEPLRLTPKEFKLLETLIKQPGRAWSRLDLLEQVFGFDYEGLERTVDVHVMNLRRKIEHDPARPEYIQTVYGIGYKIAEDDDVA